MSPEEYCEFHSDSEKWFPKESIYRKIEELDKESRDVLNDYFYSKKQRTKGEQGNEKNKNQTGSKGGE